MVAVVRLGSRGGCAGLAFGAAAVLAGCAGGRAVAGPSPQPAVAAPADSLHVRAQDAPPLADLGPEILLPPTAPGDDEVARVGDLVLRKSHAYTRLLTADPKLALSAIDLLVFDVLVARHAQQYGIRVAAERVEELAAAEEQQMRQKVQAELGGEVDFPAYVWQLFGMHVPDWQRTLRLRTAQRLYHGYVIRYLGLREDRVQVRYLVHKDRAVVQEVVDKVRAGADFATLALRSSEDAYRRDGGLLPAFGRGFPHPVADVAFTLQKGEVAAPFQAKVGDETRWFTVYCLDRFDGRDVPFADVRDDLDRELLVRPLAPIETSAYSLRWRSQIERAPGAPGAAEPR